MCGWVVGSGKDVVGRTARPWLGVPFEAGWYVTSLQYWFLF